MQIYKKLLKLYYIRQLNFITKIKPKSPYQKNRILQLFFEFILIKLSTSLQCQKRLNCPRQIEAGFSRKIYKSVTN